MIKRGPEQCAPLKSAGELSRQLFHPADGRQLGHVFAQHVKVFQQHCALIIQGWLESLPAVHSIFNLPKNPRIRHRSPTDQDAIASGFPKTIERLLDRGDVAAAGNGHLHHFLDLLHQIPIRQSAIALLLRAAVQGNMFSPATFGQLRGLDCIDRVIVKAGANLYGQGNRDGLLNLREDGFQSRIVF